MLNCVENWIMSNPLAASFVALLIIAALWGLYQKRRADSLTWAAEVVTFDELVRQAADAALTRRVEAAEAACQSQANG